MALVNQAITRVSVDGQQAQNELKRLEDLAKAYKQRMVEAKKAGDNKTFDAMNKELNKVNKEMQGIIRSSFDVNKVMSNLSASKPKELRKAISALNKEMNSGRIERGSKEWDVLQEKMRLVREELKKINGESQKNQSKIGSLSQNFSKFFGVLAGGLATVTGLAYAMNRLDEEVAKLDDVYSDVMKSTGLSRSEVASLNKEFDKLNTRVPREELNKLAYEAGKLGNNSFDSVFQFVEASVKIKAALGKDLGEDGIKDIGKMVDVYKQSTKELQDLGLRDQLLSIGSAINELGMSSTASEGYLVDFTKRLGGVSSQAGISIQNVLGYASALDQSGQSVEVAATSMQNFIMKLVDEPAKFAKIAGLEIEKFNNLLKNDTNEAIKEVLNAMSQKGGFEQLIPIFKEMGLDGARSVGVLSALATNIDKITEAQIISNKAFEEANSIDKEYNIKNNNKMAILERSKQAFADARVELGERLNPTFAQTTDLVTYVLKLLPPLIDFFMKYANIITATVVSLASYLATVKLVTLFTGKWTLVTTLQYRALQLQNGIMIVLKGTLYALQVAYYTLTNQVVKARGAMLAFSAVTGLTNPLILITGALAALTAGLYIFSQRTKEAESNAKLLNEVMGEANKKIAEEKTELNLLLRIAKNEQIAKSERLDAIKKLNQISPEYLGNLNLENINTQYATKSIQEYTKALLKNARAKAIQEKISEIEEKRIDNEIKINEMKQNISDITRKNKEKYKDPKVRELAEKFAPTTYESINLNTLQKEKKELDDQISKYTSLFEEDAIKNTDYSKTLKNNTVFLEDQLSIEKQKLEVIEKQQATLMSKEGKTNNIFDAKSDYITKQELQNIDVKLDFQRKIVEEKQKDLDLSKKIKNTQNESVDLNLEKTSAVSNKKVGGQAKKDVSAKNREIVQKQLMALEIENNNKMMQVKSDFNNGIIVSEQELNNKLLDLSNDYDRERIKALNDLKSKISDQSVMADVLKQISELDKAIIDREIKRNAEVKKIILDANPAKMEQAEYEQRLKNLNIYGETANTLTYKISNSESEIEKTILKEKLEALQILEKNHLEKMRSLQSSDATFLLKNIEDNQKKEVAFLTEKHKKGLIKERDFNAQMLLIELNYASQKMQAQGISEENRLKAEEDFLTKKNKIFEENEAIKTRLKKKETNDSIEEMRDFELSFLDNNLKNNLQNEELYQELRLGIIDKYNLLEEERDKQKKERMMQASMFAINALQELTNGYASYLKTSNDLEIAQINSKYEAQIKAAGNNDKKRQRIEKQRDDEIAKKKKEAEGKSFKIQVSMALAQTAQSAINAYSSTAAIPIIGPALAPVAAAVATASGMLQVANIKKQQQLAGYSKGGFTPKGKRDEIQGFVHSDEFVGNSDSMQNPFIYDFYTVVNNAQKNNTVRNISPDILFKKMDYTERVAGISYKNNNNRKKENEQLYNDNIDVANTNKQLMHMLLSVEKANAELISVLKQPLNVVNSVTGDNGMKQAFDRYNKMIDNKTRK